jgi:Flp pilus assembly protein TadD
MNKTDRRSHAKRQVAAELSARAAKRRDSGPTPKIRNSGPTFTLVSNKDAKGKDSTENVLYRAARKASNEQQGQRAVGIFRELLLLNPANVKARLNLALLLFRDGDQDGALIELERAHSIDPEDSSVLIHRGAIRGVAGRFADAENDLRRVLRAEPSNPEAHFELGLLMSRRGLWRDAIPFLRRAVELDSSRPSAYYYLGEALNHVDDLGGALLCFQRAVELRPNSPKTLYGMGIVLDRLSRPDEAAQMYRRSRELAHQ